MASDDPSAANQHVEDLALVVDGTPEIHPLVGDLDHHLVQLQCHRSLGRAARVAWPDNLDRFARGEPLDNVVVTSEMLPSAPCR